VSGTPDATTGGRDTSMDSVRSGRRLRNTRQGGLVRDQLSAKDAFRSAQSVFSELRAKDEPIGLSTVYRHLQALADAGEADTLQTPDGEALYRLCGQTTRHHHHLVCRRCGHTLEIEGRGVERWAAQMAELHGFTEVDHTVELLGLCGSCGGTG
jgi:Fur family ferric uptake transcriptional regulator